jgi:hypothetical protein
MSTGLIGLECFNIMIRRRVVGLVQSRLFYLAWIETVSRSAVLILHKTDYPIVIAVRLKARSRQLPAASEKDLASILANTK